MAEGLYSDIEAPVFSSIGGEFDSLVNLTMSSLNAEEIYYTTDNSDPREIGGAVSQERAILYSGSINLAEDVIVKARAKSGDEWSALTRARFRFTTSLHDTTISVSICQGENYFGMTNSGNVYLTETSSSGTDSIIKVQLTVHKLPHVFLGPDTSIILSDTLILESNAEYASYLWNTSETTGSIEAIGNEAGEYNYWLRVADENGCSNSDTIVVTVDRPDYIYEESFAQAISIYPNPARDHINIKFANGNRSDVDIEIYSQSGSLVFKKSVSIENINEQVSLDRLPEAIYLIKIRIGNSERVFKIIKQ
jgi:hypothetical protein